MRQIADDYGEMLGWVSRTCSGNPSFPKSLRPPTLLIVTRVNKNPVVLIQFSGYLLPINWGRYLVFYNSFLVLLCSSVELVYSKSFVNKYVRDVCDIFQNCRIDIDIDTDIDIFQNCLIDIDIDIDIFKTCRYIDNRYGLSIYRTPLIQRKVVVQKPKGKRLTHGRRSSNKLIYSEASI